MLYFCASFFCVWNFRVIFSCCIFPRVEFLCYIFCIVFFCVWNFHVYCSCCILLCEELSCCNFVLCFFCVWNFGVIFWCCIFLFHFSCCNFSCCIKSTPISAAASSGICLEIFCLVSEEEFFYHIWETRIYLLNCDLLVFFFKTIWL